MAVRRALVNIAGRTVELPVGDTLAATAGGGGVGTAVLNFGADPGTDAATVTVTGQTGITAASHVEAWFMADSTAENTADDHSLAQSLVRLTARNIVAGTGFGIDADVQGGQVSGTMKVHWVWN
jgi:NADPH:quinone reductase-like Zn-dependent oxidoreductase